MNNLFKVIKYYLSFPLVRRILIVEILVAVCASLLGVILVLKRFSFIGDGLSHTAFGATAIASVIGLTNNTLIVLPVTVLCAILLLKTSQNKKIKGDALIAMLSVSALAVGYLLLNVFNASSNLYGDVCSVLFASTAIFSLAPIDVWVSAILCGVIILFFIFFYNKIFAVTFDENFAKASGTKPGVYNTLIAVIIAVVIVVAMKLVGSLLVSALVIFPALSSMRVFKSFKAVTICSGIISALCAFCGIIISIIFDTPVGATVIVANLVCFLIFFLLGLIIRR